MTTANGLMEGRRVVDALRALYWRLSPRLRMPCGFLVHALAVLVLGLSAVAHAQSPVAIRVNAGAGAYTDSAGNAWSADTGFNTGDAGCAPCDVPIAGTNDPEIYRSQRWNANPEPPVLAYAFDVPNGFYMVRLHFAETYAALFGQQRRVFDVRVEGRLALDNLDIWATAGDGNRALIRTLNVEVEDGRLNIEFVREIDNPVVSGLGPQGAGKATN